MTRPSQLTLLPRPAIAAPAGPVRDTTNGLQTSSVYALFTTIDETLAAIRAASVFAKAMEVPMTVLHLREVSYAIPVDAPAGISPIETAEFAQSVEREGSDTRLQVFLCREALEALPLALSSPSLVVIGGRRGWWGSRSARWRRALEALGHLVIFAGNAESEVVSLSRTQGVFRA
jgi:hypothetical protein